MLDIGISTDIWQSSVGLLFFKKYNPIQRLIDQKRPDNMVINVLRSSWIICPFMQMAEATCVTYKGVGVRISQGTQNANSAFW